MIKQGNIFLVTKLLLLSTSLYLAEEIVIHQGVIWKQQDSTLYDSSFPLLLEIPWSKSTITPPPSTLVSEHGRGMIFKPLNNMSFELNKFLETLESNMEESSKEQKKKSKRGINWIGDSLHYCCSVISENTLGSMSVSQSGLNSALNGFRNGLTSTFGNISSSFQKIERFSAASSRNFEKLNMSITSLTQEMQSIQNASSEFDDFMNSAIEQFQLNLFNIYKIVSVMEEHSIIRKCADRRLPRELISQKLLKQKLIEIQTAARAAGRVLAIPLEKIHSYYDLQTVSCLFSPETVLVRLAIPLKRLEEPWSLFKVQPIPFFYQNQACRVHLTEEAYLISKSGMVRAARGLECMNELCYTERVFSNAADGEEGCVDALRTSVVAKSIQGRCKIKCGAPGGPEVYQYQTDKREKYIIAGDAKDLTVDCHGVKNRIIASNSIGALQVDIPCNCILISRQGIILVDTDFPCVEKNVTGKTSLVLPKFLTVTSRHVGTHHTSYPNETHDSIINHNWTLEYTVLNLTRPVAPSFIKLSAEKIQQYIPFDSFFIIVLVQSALWIVLLIRFPGILIPARWARAVPSVGADEMLKGRVESNT